MTEFYRGAGRLVRETLLTLPPEGQVPNSSTLQRCVNRAREQIRPKHPTSLDFEVCMNEYACPFCMASLPVGQIIIIINNDNNNNNNIITITINTNIYDSHNNNKL